MDRKAQILARIEQLLEIEEKGIPRELVDLIPATVSVLIQVYGVGDSRTADFLRQRDYYLRSSGAYSNAENVAPVACAVLKSTKADVEAGWVESLERTYSGIVIADFVVMARNAIAEGRTEVASVLACAALEDALKRTGELAGLAVSEQEMPGVINELVKAGIIAGPQSKLVRSFSAIRNKAMHAEFDKVDSADVKAVIGFTEAFILKNLSA
ncbi:MAG: hypothetical protein JNM62_09375 [Flavobacteriales bacterium]|nr:hypothetical protein [Flavobacteriales bacterium]